ncbi:MAG: BBP7 family outer membrane beta-barrel protein [Pirellulales bacterium]|nr:BBP7 family outer membrane beta-barrel protein [Pirellulales bacterium]
MRFIKIFARSGRIAGTVGALLLICIGLGDSPINAQTNAAGVPPWQLPPGGARTHQSAPIERMAYDAEVEGTPESGIHPAQTAPSHSPRALSEPVGDNSIDRDAGGSAPWSDGEEIDCSSGFCLRPFANRLWVRSEFLSMWGKSANLKPLATSSNSTVTDRTQAGVLGLPTTRVLFGGENEGSGYAPGGRFTLGYKCNPCEDTGLEVVYAFLGQNSADFHANNSSTPILARPFYDVQRSVQDSLVVAFPNQQTGSLNIGLSNEFHSLEMLWRQSMTAPNCRQVDFLAGYRYGSFAETLSVNSTSTYIAQVGTIPVGTIVRVNDRFSAQNDFQGGVLGIATKQRYCRWSVELLGKMALGNTHSTIDIGGNRVVTVPSAAPETSSGGLLAQSTNSGRFEEHNFTVIPELGITLGYDLTERLQATLGYSFIYWSRVARPTDQLDLNVNPDPASGGNPAPLFRYVPGDYWVQGLTVGLDYRF